MDPVHGSQPSVRTIPMARSMCWHCQSEVTGEYLCGQCVKVQPLSRDLDYFTCLNLSRLLQIDEKKLESTFYELSRTFHPDFYSTKDDSEKSISLGNAALINTAYRTLKDPIQRAEYLIRLEAGAVKEIRANPPADLFEEILELQDDLEEFRSLSSDKGSHQRVKLRAKLQTDCQTLEQRQAQLEKSLFEKFETWDALQTQSHQSPEAQSEKRAVLKDMQEILSNRTYVRNIVRDLVETTE